MEDHVPITADWGIYIWGVLLFEWVLIFEKSVASVSMGKGYLYLMGIYTPENTVCMR